MRTLIDLYHITSHPMYYDVDNEKAITGQEAINLGAKLGNMGAKYTGFMPYKRAKTFSLPGWPSVRAYGQIISIP